MPKYRDFFRQMLDENEDLFSRFAEIHAKYQLNQNKWQDDFNRVGEEAMVVMRDYERKLCGKTERGNNAVFSSRLADKYWSEVKAFFPMVDFIGVEVSGPVVKLEKKPQSPTATPDPDIAEIEALDDDFEIRKLF